MWNLVLLIKNVFKFQIQHVLANIFGIEVAQSVNGARFNEEGNYV